MSMNQDTLSRRALASLNRGRAADYFFKISALPQYDAEQRPDGLINLAGAVNSLMRDWTDNFARSQNATLDLSKLTGYGPLFGSEELRIAVANIYNTYFDPFSPVEPRDVLAVNGVTSGSELLSWAICDPGDVIICPVPTFFMQDFNLGVRTGVKTVTVSLDGIDDPFAARNAEACVQAIAKAIDEASGRCRAVFLCNPQNPEGRCYSKRTLIFLARMCAKRSIHFAADEIYALSYFGDGTFSSILAAAEPEIEPFVHSFWGMSKDFGMGGLRLGYMVTRNERLRETLKRLTWFTWPSAFSDAFSARFLSDANFMKDYVGVYQTRLRAAYNRVTEALDQCQIPYQPATAGLFLFTDLSQWVHHFRTRRNTATPAFSPELQLWQWLVDHGVGLNAGEFAGGAKSGMFRLVFTEDVSSAVLGVRRIRKALDMLGHNETQLVHDGSRDISSVKSFAVEFEKPDLSSNEKLYKSSNFRRFKAFFGCFS